MRRVPGKKDRRRETGDLYPGSAKKSFHSNKIVKGGIGLNVGRKMGTETCLERLSNDDNAEGHRQGIGGGREGQFETTKKSTGTNAPPYRSLGHGFIQG